MNQYEFYKLFPSAIAEVTKTVQINQNVFGTVQLMNTGHLLQTWKDPCDNARFVDISIFDANKLKTN